MRGQSVNRRLGAPPQRRSPESRQARVHEIGSRSVGGNEYETRTCVPISSLTTQEQRVASVVAGGARNYEAAAQLFISPKTVEFHLTNIYRKLGLRSRTELANHMSKDGHVRALEEDKR
jgi:DNA-binding NarL/FixJ family response regulator